MKSEQKVSDAVLIFVTLLWGSTFQVSKVLGHFFGPFSYLAIRYLLASILVMAFFHKKLVNVSFTVIYKSMLLALIMLGGMGFQIIGLRYIDASKSAFITAISVVMVPVFMFLFYKKKQGISTVIGVLTAYLGLFIMSDIDFRNPLGKGEYYTFLCALCWTFYVILTNKFVKEDDPLLINIMQLIFTALFFTFVWVLFDHQTAIFTWYSTIWVFIMGFLCTGVAFSLYTFAQQHTSPSHSALILTFEPVFATLFALVIPDLNGRTESLTLQMIVGGGLIFLSTIIIELKLFDNLFSKIKKIDKQK